MANKVWQLYGETESLKLGKETICSLILINSMRQDQFATQIAIFNSTEISDLKFSN
ncbi:hypothetical protein H4R33_006983, partial [Dimargaris cristalligena]